MGLEPDDHTNSPRGELRDRERGRRLVMHIVSEIAQSANLTEFVQEQRSQTKAPGTGRKLICYDFRCSEHAQSVRKMSSRYALRV